MTICGYKDGLFHFDNNWSEDGKGLPSIAFDFCFTSRSEAVRVVPSCDPWVDSANIVATSDYTIEIVFTCDQTNESLCEYEIAYVSHQENLALLMESVGSTDVGTTSVMGGNSALLWAITGGFNSIVIEFDEDALEAAGYNSINHYMAGLEEDLGILFNIQAYHSNDATEDYMLDCDLLFDDECLDTDGDGLCDASVSDVCPYDADNDADGDGVCGDVDQCAGFDDNADADGDGIADGCDICPYDAANDADSDGVCDDVDDCVGSYDAVGVCNGTCLADVNGNGICDSDEGPHFNLIHEGNPYLAMNIYVISAILDELYLVDGDEIGIFDGELLVGAGVVACALSDLNCYVSIVAATDYPTTDAIDGFMPGNQITFKFWDHSESEEIDFVNTLEWMVGDGVFTSLGTAVVNLEGLSIVEQTIALTAGWNLISFNHLPENMSLLNILQPLNDEGLLIEVQDEAGAKIEYQESIGWVDAIGDMAVTEGYLIKVSEAMTLSSTGVPVPLPHEISLSAGWNIMGYPAQTEQDALAVFQSLIDDGSLIKVQDEAGYAIEELPVIGLVDNIGRLQPGEGYYVGVETDVLISISWPSASSSVRAEAVRVDPVHFSGGLVDTGNAHDAANFYVSSATIDGVALASGDEIGIYDGELLVGVGVLDCGALDESHCFLSIVALKDNPETSEIDGFVVGHSISYKLWDASEQLEMTEVAASYRIGEDFFSAQATYVVNLSITESVGLDACLNAINSDTDCDGDVDIQDVLNVIEYLISPTCGLGNDANSDYQSVCYEPNSLKDVDANGEINATDLLATLDHAFDSADPYLDAL